MRIKLLVSTILLGFKNALPAGAVVESEEAQAIEEFNGLSNIGYAKITTEEVTHRQDGHEDVKPVLLVEDDNGDKFEPQDGDTELLGLLEESIPNVIENLDALSADELARLAVLEARGKNRKGVLEAIGAAQSE